MPQEIERKFLVRHDGYKEGASKSYFRQGYLCSHKDRVVRVRIAADSATLSIKGATVGAVRPEFEYPIPLKDAQALLDLCEKPLVEKYRYTLSYGGMTWEVDEFSGDNEGLVVAEIELTSEGQDFQKPDWVGKEVTYDSRYYNAALIHSPYKTWIMP